MGINYSEGIMEHKELFLKTSVLRLFFIAALPGAISMLASSLYGFFDGIFVGQILGENAFAALNLAFPLIIVNFALSDLIAVGSAVPISIALGRRDEAEANNIFTCALLMIFGSGIFMGTLLWVGSPILLRILGPSEEVQHLAVQYIRTYAAFSPLITAGFALDNYLRISGKTKFGMWLSISVSIGTAALEFFFLFVLKLGIWGAALANCLSMLAYVLIAFLPFALGKFQLTLTRPKFSAKTTKQIIKSGTPIFLANISSRVTSFTMSSALISMGGDDAVAIYGIPLYVGEIIQPVIYGICDSTQPAIGYNWGAKRYDRVKGLAKCIFSASAIVSLISFAMMWLIPDTLVSLFAPEATPEFTAEAVVALKLYAFSKLIFWFSFATQSYMTAVEKPFYATLLSVGSSFVFPMLFIFALYNIGLFGIWLNAPLTMLATTLLAVVILISFSKEFRKKEKLEQADIQ